MKDINELMVKILQLTLDIETNYPELYRFLDENPITMPSEVHPNIDKKVLKEYLESLNELLKHHIEAHVKHEERS